MYEITDGTIRIFTYREGLLSAVGHDLQLSVGRFLVRADGAQVTVELHADSLVVDGAVRDGALDPRALSAKDLRDIRDNTVGKKILHTARHPVIRVTGTLRALEADTHELAATATLVGRSAPITVPIRSEGGRLRGALTLAPSRWGIAPFKALLGTLRIQDRVDVRFDLPDPR